MNSLPIPNYTQIPNFILDEKMSELSHSEFKVIMLILRYTIGCTKNVAIISHEEICKKCGIEMVDFYECCDKLTQWIEFDHGEKSTEFELLEVL